MLRKNKALSKENNLLYVSLISIAVAMGGFLFGYDTAVISGAMNPLIKFFHLESDTVLQGWMVSSVLLGSIFGAAVAGFLADRFGRRNNLFLAAILFLISAIGSTIAPTFTFFVTVRLIGGVAVGIAAMVVPLYIAEVSPPAIRGRMVSMYQFAIAIGVLVAYFSNDFFRVLSENHIEAGTSTGFWSWILTDVWRIMLSSEIIPCILFLGMLFFVPVSPRFMIMKGNEKAAFKVLKKVAGLETAKNEIEEIKSTISHETGSLKQLFEPGLRKATFIALFLAAISQFTGIDIILHYGPVILERAGFSFGESLYGQIILGFVLVVFTLLAMWKVDSLGRRKLLYIGNAGIFLSLLTMGYFYYSGIPSEIGLLIAISVFIASFAFSFGPIPWIIMSEIFPTKIRGRAMSLATLALFSVNWLVAQLFPYMSATFGEHGTFWLLAIISIPTFFFIWKVLPETKGRSLEEIEQSWK